jgi:hypothetical protein
MARSLGGSNRVTGSMSLASPGRRSPTPPGDFVQGDLTAERLIKKHTPILPRSLEGLSELAADE